MSDSELLSEASRKRFCEKRDSPPRQKTLEGKQAAKAIATKFGLPPKGYGNLNTHTKGAFYEAFKPRRAFSFAGRVNFLYTPKHGS